MLKQELKKVFLKRRFLFVFLALMAAQAILLTVSAGREGLAGFDKETYEHFVQTYRGELTEEKSERLKTVFLCLESADEALMFGEAFYQSGEYSREAFLQLQTELSQYVSGRTGLNVFREQCEYAAAKPGRQIVNGEAWKEIFSNETADIVCVLAIIIYTVSAYVAENETNFTLLRLSAPKGKRSLYRLELALGMGTAAAFSLVCSALRFLIAAAKWPLRDLDAPLESIPLFENTAFGGSLLQGYLAVTLLKMLGAMAFCALCFILGNLLTTSVSVLLAGLLSVVLPQYLLRDARIYYFSPVSLLRGTGFLFGSVIIEEEGALPFVESEAAGPLALPASLCLAAAITVTAFLYCKKRGRAT